jgi:invasion protein IalB
MSNGGKHIFSTIITASLVVFAAVTPSPAQFGWMTDSTKTVAQQAPPPAPKPQSPPQVAKTETSQVGNWLLTCVDYANGSAKRSCVAKLQILQDKTNVVAFVWEIGVTNDRKFVSVMHVPTGIMIEPGVELRVGKAAPRKIAYNACAQAECTSQFPIDEKLIKDIAANPKIEAAILAVNGSTLTFQIDPTGIDKAFAQMGN